ncbi:immunoglobulin-like domain-containing protein [Marinobacter salexigens]|uniref:immunoglobulin-like domain-containing protein n=1 Tax=Marinobacter salexigens TaxID=1925763 RepID=UPI000C290BD5|nr:immunoglobulin-like domain-containing protein [Marinobacter salexigens]
MTTLAIVVTLVGQAWAENANGERRALEVGDQLAVDETLIMAEGARIDLDFGDNQQLTFLGEQQVTAEARGELIDQGESLDALESGEQPEPVTPVESGGGSASEGHGFVQLVRIGEIIEADGYTPVTVAQIQEVLRPFGLALPQQDFVRGTERDGTRYDEQGYPETGSKLAKLSISIDVITGDDIVDATEAGQSITLTGTVGGGVSAGDTVTVTVNGQNYSTTVNADGKTWQVDVPGSELAKDNRVQATVNSVEPNGTPVSESAERPYLADDKTPSVKVELEQGSGDNGQYSQADTSDGKVQGTITFDPNTTAPGDKVTVTDKDGNPVTDANGAPVDDYELSQSDIDNGIKVDVSVAINQTYVEMNAIVTDPAGNSSTGFDRNPKDNTTPKAEVELEPGSGPNGEYNDDDISDGKVTGTVTFDPDTSVGDTVKITDKDGNVIIERPVTQDDIDNGITVDIPVADGQTNVEMNVEVTDPAGNTSSTDDSKPVDNLTPGVAVELEPGSGTNGKYDAGDFSSGKIEGEITFDPSTTSPGDKITATDKDGNPILDSNGDPITDYEITQGDIDNGITVEVPVGPGDTDVELNVDITDPAGNTSTGSDSNPADGVVVTAELAVSATSVDEGTATDLQYSVTLKDTNGDPVVANNDITVNTTVGTITISAGNSAGTLDIPVQGDDVYLDGETITGQITNIVENGLSGTAIFENLTFDNTPVQTTVNDTLDTVTAKLTVSETAVDEGEVNNLIYTATLKDAANNAVTANNDVTVTTSLGTITIKAGDSFGVLVVPVQGDDVYIDSEPVSNKITAVVEGNAGTSGAFEDLAFDNTPVQTVVSDTTDTTTATLSSAGSGDEDNGAITYTISLDNAPQDAQTFDLVLSNGQAETITVAAGAKTGSVTFGWGSGLVAGAVQMSGYPDSDVHLEPDDVLTVDSIIASGTGGNFEDLVVVDNSSGLTISDSIDTTTATLTSAGSGDEDNGSVTYAVSLDHATEGDQDFTVALSNGQNATIQVTAGATSGSVTLGWGTGLTGTAIALSGYPSPDVYLKPDFVLAVDSVTASGTGGNFESLVVVDNSTDLTIADTIDTTTATLTSVGGGDEDNGSITYTVDLSNAPQADQLFSLTLSNGQTANISVAAGSTSGTITFGWGTGVAAGAQPLAGYPDSDAHLEPDFDLTVTDFAALGNSGNFEDLAVVDNSTDLTITDSIDITTAVLTSVGNGDEDNGAITYSVNLDNPAQAAQDFTINLSNGQTETITVAAGATTGSVTFGWGSGLSGSAIALTGYPDSDVYIEPDFVLGVDSITASGNGGNFEDLTVVDNSTDLTIADTIDTTTVTLDDVTVNEGADIIISATVGHAPQNTDLVLTLDNGQTITIAVGDTTGSVTFANPKGDTPYVDSVTQEYEITGSTGGNYENLDTSDKAIVTVEDTQDTTTVTLTDSTLDEGANITITAEVDNAPQDTDLVLTLSNGEQITIAAGTTSGSVTFTNPNGEDVYQDGETLEYDIIASSGGNYENLDTTAKSTITVEDTTGTVTAKLSVSKTEINEGDAADLVYTVTLEDSNGNPVTTNNSITVNTTLGDIVIGAGNTHGAINVPVQADDAYVNAGTVENEITGIIETNSGQPGSFEKLEADTTAVTTRVNDVTTPTTITLSDITGFEGETHTMTATVDHAVTENDLVVTLSNGEAITIAVGQTSGTSDPFLIQTDDVYVDAGSYTVSIDSTAGGNYEQLIKTATSTVTVNDTIDPVYAIIEVNHNAVLEGGELEYTVSLVDSNNNPVTVATGKTVEVGLHWTGTATAADVDNLPGSVSINAGASDTTFTVKTVTDSLPELSEQLTVVIDSVTDNNGTDKGFEDLQIGHQDNSATVTIFDNPSISATDITVYEKGLTDGSSAGDGTVTRTGTMLVSAPTGLDSITIGGETITFNQLENGHTISVAGGNLTINSFTPTAQSNGNDAQWEIEYSYTLTGRQAHTTQGTDDVTLDLALSVVATDPTDSNLTITESGNNLVVTVVDDIPTIELSGDTPGTITVQEADIDSNAATATADFSTAFEDAVYGADGDAGTGYELVINSPATGLKDLDGNDVKLSLNGSVIEGKVGTNVLFTIEVDQDGKVTLTQHAPLLHGETHTSTDVQLAINKAAISLKATATDGDGDTAPVALENIGDRFVFQDDGPALKDGKVDQDGFVIGNEIVDEKYLPSGSDSDNVSLTVTNDLPIDFGADGAISADGTVGLKFSNTDILEALGLTSGTKALAYEISGDGHTITAKTDVPAPDSKPNFTITLSVDGTGKPSYEFTLQGPLDHTLNADGETADNIVLPFEITATDGDGDSVGLKFNVEVVDDTPDIADRELDVNEDGSVGFSNADINTSTVSIQAATQQADDPEGKAVWDLTGGHGQVLVGNDGTITYKPNEDYRGEDSYTYTVTTDGGTYDRTVNITVKPVADKPLFADENGNYPDNTAIDPDGSLNTGTYDYSVQTDEDVSVGLQLHVPKVKDGGSAATSDPAELLGAITLGFKDLAADYTPELQLQLANGTVLSPDASGGFQFVIVDNETDKNPLDWHLKKGLPAEGNGVHYLTEAQYEGLQVQPPAERHENFKTEVSVASYEVDAQGEQLAGVNGATSTQTVDVILKAVTDPIELKVDTDKDAHSYEMDEDTTFNLKDELTVNYPDNYVDGRQGDGVVGGDLDGSETRWFEITGLPKDTVVNGTTVTGPSHVISIEAPGLSTTDNGLPDINITPPKDFSGDMAGITVTLKAQDKDTDAGDSDGLVEEDSITLELQVNPVAGDVEIKGTEGLEDQAIAFLENVKVTDDSTASGTLGEVITEVSFTVPTGWTADGAGNWSNTDGQTWTMEPSTSAGWTGVWDGNKYTITFDDTDPTTGLSKEAREDILKEFTVTPPAHSSKDIGLEVEVTSVDHSVIDGGLSSDPAIKEGTLTVVVKPVAEDVDTNSDGADGKDVTMGGDHVYQTSGEEDGWLVLGDETSTGFKLSNNWSNEDGKWVDDGSGNWSEDTTYGRSEDTFALLTPFKTENNSAKADANTAGELEGSVFTYSDGTTTFTLPFAGDAVKIPMQYLDSVQFKGPADWAGVVKIKVEAHTTDYDEDDDSITDEATSGEAWLTNLIIEPRADQVTLKVDAIIKTDEDVPVDLNIIPTSSDPSETFDVTIKGIPKGAKIEYDGTEYEAGSSVGEYDSSDEEAEGLFKVTEGSDVSYILVIKDFDTDKQPTLTPPKDSNVTISLDITAQSVDTLDYIDSSGAPQTITNKDPSKSHTLTTEVQVQGVPDKPLLTLVQDKVYIEDADNQDSGQLKVTLSDLITELKSGETGVDGAVPDVSETVTLRISGLPEGFSLEKAGPALGGSGEGRVWVITKADLEKTGEYAVQITVPKHHSGTVKLTAQPVVTENDNPSEIFFAPQNVSFDITPVPEATLSISSSLTEDTIGELELMPVGDDSDEYISAVRIAEDAVNTAGVTLYDANDNPLTASGGFYTVNNTGTTGAPVVKVKGPANYSGNDEIKLDIQYQVIDPVTSGSGSAVTSGWQTQEHTLNFAPVTDEIVLSLGDIDGGTTAGEVTTAEKDSTVTVGLKITQKPDVNADNKSDTDSSEKFTHVVISGVPGGVSVKGAVETAKGEWLLTVGDLPFNTAELTHALEFLVSGYADTFEQAITITTYTQDTGADFIEKDSLSWTLKYVSSTGPDAVDLPELVLEAVNNSQTEDEPFALGDVVTGTLTTPAGTTDNQFEMTVAIRTTPDDETDFSGMTRTLVTENGQPVALWTKTVSGVTKADAQTQLDDLLGSITVTPPQDANSNNLAGGTLDLDVNVAVHADGVSRDSQAMPQLPITPVTDELVITVSENVVDEGENISLDIGLSSKDGADGTLGAPDAGWTVVGDIVFIHIADGLNGELYVDGTESLGSETAPAGVPTGLPGGKYYEVSVIDLDKLEFRPDKTNHPFQTGSLGVTVWVEHIENNDVAGSKVSTGTGSLTIVQSNSGYEATITAEGPEAQVSGDKANAIELGFGADAGLVDANEEVSSAYISGLPSGFTVYMGADATNSTMANNAGEETWAIPVTGGVLPAYIAILPPAHWSGSLTGVNLTVLSGHEGLAPAPTVLPIKFEVTPVASGITLDPTPSFGDAGDKVALNLNASMKDPSTATGAVGDEYTELTELSLTGFPDGQKVLFFIGDAEEPLDEPQATFDGDAWTINGLSQSDLQNLKFLHAQGSGNITVKGRTYEVDADGNPYQEGGNTKYSDWSVDKTAEINISPTVPTSGDDHFLWGGEAINGFGGEDTVQLRFGDDLGSDDFSKLKNIEIIDMKDSGANKVGEAAGLSIQDVLDMTDENNVLKIDGDSDDSVFLKSSEWAADDTGTDGYVTYTNSVNSATLDISEQITKIIMVE